jgi:predicted transcriptional regulator
MSRKHNPQRVKLHFSYTIDEIARLLGVHKNTVRSWFRAGLETIDSSRPTMVQGRVLRVFLERRRSDRKRKCGPGTFYCFKCRAPKAPALAMVDYVQRTSSSGNLKALCESCSSIMHRHVQIDQIAAVMPKINVQFTHPESRIRESAIPSLNCDARKEALA